MKHSRQPEHNSCSPSPPELPVQPEPMAQKVQPGRTEPWGQQVQPERTEPWGQQVRQEPTEPWGQQVQQEPMVSLVPLAPGAPVSLQLRSPWIREPVQLQAEPQPWMTERQLRLP